MDVALGVIIGAVVSLLTKIVGDMLSPEAKKHRNLAISLLVGFIALSAFIAWRSSVDDAQGAPITASNTPTPYSGNTQIIHVSEGNQERVVLGNSEILS